MFSETYKADDSIFKSTPTIDLTDILLRGIFLDFIETEAQLYLLNSKDLLIKRFLPFAYVDNEKSALEKLYEYSNRFVSKAGIFFCLMRKDKPAPFGYILCHSPSIIYLDSQKPIGDWTIDFWLGERARGYGIMTSAVYNVLIYLNQKNVPRVYAFVDKQNEKSIRLLKRCKMILVDETYDRKMFKYGVRLNNTSEL